MRPMWSDRRFVSVPYPSSFLAPSGNCFPGMGWLTPHQVLLEPGNGWGRGLGKPGLGVGVEVLAALHDDERLGFQRSLVGGDGQVRRREGVASGYDHQEGRR